MNPEYRTSSSRSLCRIHGDCLCNGGSGAAGHAVTLKRLRPRDRLRPAPPALLCCAAVAEAWFHLAPGAAWILLCWTGRMAGIVFLLCLFLAVLDKERIASRPEQSTGFGSLTC
ncbi:hypothetical protein CgunFtcFv8_006775 [Champsocephalus gunnari]|uniref:Uncharacterized protein n=1 Tax=Champsocephalus gunnari TaxID=52237 RepID=A0AAN8CK83_CHAGU|nr:hypothetical protein CgunFtcFv8_006775 [Champsocephalus gunnari]